MPAGRHARILMLRGTRASHPRPPFNIAGRMLQVSFTPVQRIAGAADAASNWVIVK